MSQNINSFKEVKQDIQTNKPNVNSVESIKKYIDTNNEQNGNQVIFVNASDLLNQYRKNLLSEIQAGKNKLANLINEKIKENYKSQFVIEVDYDKQNIVTNEVEIDFIMHFFKTKVKDI